MSKPVEKKQEPDVAESNDKIVDDEVTQEIDGAVEDTVKKIESEREPPEKPAAEDDDREIPEKELPPDEDNSSADDDEGKKPDDDEGAPSKKPDDTSGAITDEQVERAVKAGLSISDAKAFQSPDALERVCSVLEAKSAPKEENEPEKTDEVDDDEVDLGEIPDLDPEEYDEEIVKGFSVMKKIIERQNSVIKGLKTEGATREEDWIDGQISGLGEGFADAIGAGKRADVAPGSPQAAKRAELEDKFSILEAGYKAAGKEADRNAIFKEAVSLTLGDVAAKAKEEEQAESLKKRQGQQINRPSVVKGKPKADPLEEAAADLDRKYFGK